jgi:signal transduction histidine kinase
VPQTSLFRTTSFRLTALYLALFAASTLALGAFVYWSVRSEILYDFDDRIIEERDALQRVYTQEGRDRLAAILEARGASGGALAVGLFDRDGHAIGGDLDEPASGLPTKSGWTSFLEAEVAEGPEPAPEILRALVTPLSDGSTLVVADERRRADEALRGVLTAFAWAVGATIAFGVVGGLWLSAQFLRRIDAMQFAAKGIMAGDWSRRIPVVPIDDDLSSLARTFNRLFERIQKLLLANKHVSADIAHDLRKPLARMLRRLEAARHDKGASPAVMEAIEGAIGDIQGVLETFDALLRIGQIEAGARRAGFRPLALAEIAHDVVDAFRPAADDQGRELVARLDEPLPMSGDRELLTQMIANCLDNALTHTPAGVRIEVEGKRTARGVTFSVADNGPGLPPGDFQRIFEPFYRGDASRSSPGAGLGLGLVAAIAELHGLACAASDNRPGLKITLETAPPNED